MNKAAILWHACKEYPCKAKRPSIKDIFYLIDHLWAGSTSHSTVHSWLWQANKCPIFHATQILDDSRVCLQISKLRPFGKCVIFLNVRPLFHDWIEFFWLQVSCIGGPKTWFVPFLGCLTFPKAAVCWPLFFKLNVSLEAQQSSRAALNNLPVSSQVFHEREMTSCQ